MDLGVEVFEQFHPRGVHGFRDLLVEFEAKLLELSVDGFRCAAVLVDGDDAALEVDAGLR